MMPSVPAFPPLTEPGTWDELMLAAATIVLEAEGEPVEGQVAVAWVIGTLALARGTVRAAILGRDGRAYGDGHPYEIFSCWNDDYRAQATARLSALRAPAWAWSAASAGLFRLGIDPSNGADHYLNVEATKKARADHGLPSWFDASRITATIARHTFLRLDSPMRRTT